MLTFVFNGMGNICFHTHTHWACVLVTASEGSLDLCVYDSFRGPVPDPLWGLLRSQEFQLIRHGRDHKGFGGEAAAFGTLPTEEYKKSE